MMSAALTVAAAGGGMAVVQAAGSDDWAWFRERCARLVGRGDAEAERAALARLDRTAAALDAVGDDDRERVRAVHAVLWQGEFAELIGAPGESGTTDAAGEGDGEGERERALRRLASLSSDVFGRDTRSG